MALDRDNEGHSGTAGFFLGATEPRAARPGDPAAGVTSRPACGPTTEPVPHA